MLPTVHLDAYDGISYLTHLDGTIGAIGAVRWNVFARENGATDLLDHCELARSQGLLVYRAPAAPNAAAAGGEVRNWTKAFAASGYLESENAPAE